MSIGDAAHVDDLPAGIVTAESIIQPTQMRLGSWELTVTWGPVGQSEYPVLRETVFGHVSNMLWTGIAQPVRFGGNTGEGYVMLAAELFGHFTYSVRATIRGTGALRQPRKKRQPRKR